MRASKSLLMFLYLSETLQEFVDGFYAEGDGFGGDAFVRPVAHLREAEPPGQFHGCETVSLNAQSGEEARVAAGGYQYGNRRAAWVRFV